MKPAHPGRPWLRRVAWTMLNLLLLAAMSLFGYHMGETFAMNHADTFLQVAAMSPALERGVTGPEPLLRIRFTERLNPETITEENILLMNGEFRVPLRLSYDDAHRTLSLMPSAPLTPGKDYRIVIHPDLVSLERHRLLSTFTARFRVELNPADLAALP